MMKKLSAMFLAVALVFTLAACSSGTDNKVPGVTPTSTNQLTQFTPGTYKGEATGFDGTIKVAVTVSEDKIEKVEVLEQTETENLGGAALAADKLPQAVVDGQSAEVDAVGGATMTSEAFVAAVNAALAQAGK